MVIGGSCVDYPMCMQWMSLKNRNYGCMAALMSITSL